jgi:hypothetical protein
MVHLSLRREPATIRRKANAGSNATHLSVFVDAVNYASVSSQLTEFGDSLWLGGILTMSVEKPRFRRDLAAAPVEVDGERYVEVRDPRTGGSFLFYDFEYRVALAFDGFDLDKVIPWVRLSTGLELQVDQLQAFAASLEGMGFLESEAAPAPAAEVESTRSPEVAIPESETAVAPVLPVAESAPAMSDESAANAPRSMVDEAVVAAGQEPELPQAKMPQAKMIEGRDHPEPEATCESSPPRAESSPPQPEASALQAETILSTDLLEPRPDAVEPQTEVTAATPSGAEVAPEPDPPANVATDSTSFPVLPAPRPPAPEAAPPSVPPPWTTPRPLMTPVPVTFGPILEQPSSRRRLRRSLVLFGSLGVLAAAAILALALPFLFSPQEPQRPRVRTLVVAPQTIFRYFDSAGIVQVLPGATLNFPAPGKVIRMAGVGSPIAAGDVAAAVELARPLQEQLTRQRERLAFYQQMADAMHQVGNAKEEERQVAKVELRNAKIAKTLRALSDVAVVASAPGEVEETFAGEGEMVEAGHPALRLRSAGFRATFTLPRHQVALARRLGFCQVEVEGYVFDCTQLQESADETHASVEVASIPASLLGKAAHLARARFEAAFALPLAAIAHTRSMDEVFVVAPHSRAEIRPVTVAEQDAAEVIVVQGLDAGDRVVVDVVPGLRPGARVAVVP